MRSIAALILTLAAGFLTVAPTAQAQVFEPEVFTLDNGLQVVVVTNPRAPIVMHMLWYKVGSADEPPGKSGIAHFLEHLMFKGTESLPEGEFSRIISRNGGRENAFTSSDFTAYFQTVAKDRLGLMMQHEADRMANLVLTDEIVAPEREVILEERRSRTDNEPSAQMWEMARAALWLHHPYGRPVIGWEQEMKELSTSDALDFYRTWYAPNNAILVVSGDVEPAEVLRLAETHYGPVPARAVPERRRLREPQHWAPRRVELASPQVGQPSISIAYLAPSYGTAEAGEAHALQVLAELLSGATGRLYRSLVVDQEIAIGAGSSYSPASVDLSSFTLYASPRPGVELEKLEAALRDEIERLLRDGVGEDEVARARQRLIDAAIFARDEVTTAAQVLGRNLAVGVEVAEIEAWPERIAAVTVEEIEAAARRVFQEPNSVTGVLRSQPSS